MFSFGLLVYVVQLFLGKIASPLVIFQEAHNIWFLGEIIINTFVVLIVFFFCNGRLSHDWKYLLGGMVLTCIPKVGYGFSGPFFYLYFLIGFCLVIYLGDLKTAYWGKYGKVGFVAFLLVYFIYNNLPWPLGDIQSDWRHFSIFHVGTVAFLKFFLGILGSYVALVLVHQLMPWLQGTWIFKRARLMGRYTLDIYLIQTILVEHILGPCYRNWITVSGTNYLHSMGIIFEAILTFFLSCLLLEVVVCISQMLNKSSFLSIILFFRKRTEFW